MMKSSPPDPLMLPSMSRESHTLKPYLEEQRQRVEARLRLLVPEENETPQAIHRAVRYSLFAGGKRIRPIFCLEAAHVISDDPGSDIEAISCSLELIHTYSLIHD